MNYDVIIVGAGPSGIFCAYELISKNPSVNILMIEKNYTAAAAQYKRILDKDPENKVAQKGLENANAKIE